MRDIKFRAWDKQNKKMVEVDLLGENVLHIKNSEWENVEDFEVMEFTGLKDKNGVEIYEGDIIKWGHIKGSEENPVRIAVIKIDPDILFEGLNVSCSFSYRNFAYKDTEKYVEKIGDIYTAPEILKEAANERD